MDLGDQADEAWLLSVQRKLYQWSRTHPEDSYRDMWNWITDIRNLRCAWRKIALNKGRRTAGVDGVTVAGIGVAGYGVLFALATMYRSRVQTPLRLLVATVTGLAFALRLTYVEGYVLETWCILCLSSLALIAMITVLASVLKVRAGRSA